MSAPALLLVLATTTSSPNPLSPRATQVLAAYATHFIGSNGRGIIPCPPARELRRRHAPDLTRTAWGRGSIELRRAGLLHSEQLANGRWITGVLLPRDAPSLARWSWAVPLLPLEQLQRRAGAQ